jgi:hypothetical protein
MLHLGEPGWGHHEEIREIPPVEIIDTRRATPSERKAANPYGPRGKRRRT